MQQARKTLIFIAFLGIILLLFANALYLFPSDVPQVSNLVSLIIFLIYISILIFWGCSIQKRIIHRTTKKYVLGIVFSMLFFVFLQTMRQNVLNDMTLVSRYFKYVSYLPLLSIPLLSFYAALHTGKPNGWKLSIGNRFLVVPVVFLFLGIITNELHQFAFHLLALSQGNRWNELYQPQILWFLSMAFGGLLTALWLWKLYQGCTLPKAKKRICIPIIIGITGMIYSILYVMNPSRYQFGFIETTAVVCAVTIGMWESCIQTGLIPSNTHIGYTIFFSDATIAGRIVDKNYLVRYPAASCQEIPEELMREAEKGVVFLEEDICLRSMEIPGGHILWTDTFKPVNEMLKKLRETQGNLLESHDYLQAEFQKRKSETKKNAQDRIYDQIGKELEVHLQTIDRKFKALSGDEAKFRPILAQLCVLGAYIKRRSNLILICQNTVLISGTELAYCIRESIDYLSVYGVACAFHQTLSGDISAEHGKLTYDLFEAVIEAALPTLSALLVNLTIQNENLTLKMTFEDARMLLSEHWESERIAEKGGFLSVTRDQNTGYVLLRFAKGEEN